MSFSLDDLLERVKSLSPDEYRKLHEEAEKQTAGMLWLPNPGGQTMALDSQADEMFFGGQPGGGKSSLLIGCALTQHHRSIVFRREFPQIKGLEDEAEAILGARSGYNAQEHIWRIPNSDKIMEFGSVQHEHSKRKYQGRAHDLKGFDEITAFTRSQYRYLTTWLRSTKPGQRCRIIATGNPPDTPEGLWVIQHWAPWLDETYHDPAEPGELRWAAPKDDESDEDLFFRSPKAAIAHIETLKKAGRDQNGQILPPRSRTFVPGKLDENPNLMRSGYAATLAYAGKEMRGIASGEFAGSLEDHPFQVIPTSWIVEAQKRWSPNPPMGAIMSAVAIDVAQGGPDSTTLSARYDYWFAQVVEKPGKETPESSDVLALLMKHRRDNASIIVDCGGGYGGGTVERLRENRIDVIAYKGATSGMGRTRDRLHGFCNKRAETWWRFREALDPNQAGGSPIALPNDPALRSDLAAPRFEITARGILIEEKAEIKKRIGRSPDKGDAVTMCWSEGQTALRRNVSSGGSRAGNGVGAGRPKFANVAYGDRKRRRN